MADKLPLNGAPNAGSRKPSDTEKVNRTLLLKQQMEENRMRLLQRDKEMSDSKRSLEQLFTQLDRSFSGTSINTLAKNEPIHEDAKDTKISQLEASVSSLKSEKRDLEMKLLSLETIQETKDCLEMEMSELHTRLENSLAENAMLTARVEHFHELEDENDELKMKLDQQCAENSNLKQQLERYEGSIASLEKKAKLMYLEIEEHRKVNAANRNVAALVEELERQKQEILLEKEALQCQLEEATANGNMAALVEELERKVANLNNDKQQILLEREALQSELEEARTDGNMTAMVGELERQVGNLKIDKQQILLEREALQRQLEETSANGNVAGLVEELERQLSHLGNDNQQIQLEREALREQLEVSSQVSNDLMQRIAELDQDKRRLESECQVLQTKFDELSNASNKLKEIQTVHEVKEEAKVIEASPPVKISSLGASKKPKPRKGRGSQRLSNEPAAPAAAPAVAQTAAQTAAPTEAPAATPAVAPATDQPIGPQLSELEDQIKALTNQISTLESEKSVLKAAAASLEAHVSNLDGQILALEDQLSAAGAEKDTLQQRIDLLLSEFDAQTQDNASNDLANTKLLLQSKEAECVELLAKCRELQADGDQICRRLGDADSEVFALRTKCRDVQYLLDGKDQVIQDLELRLETQTLTAASESDEVKRLGELVAELKAKISASDAKLDRYENLLDDQNRNASDATAQLHEAVRVLRCELDGAEAELMQRAENQQRLEKSLLAHQKDLEEKNRENQQLKDELQQAEVVLAEEGAKYKSLQDELNRLKMSSDADATVHALEAALNDSQMEREVLRNDLQARCSQLDECAENATRLQQLLDEARADQAQLASRCDATAAQLKSAEEKITQVSDKFKKLAANYKQKVAVIQQLEKKVEALKKIGGDDQESDDPKALQVRLIEAESEAKLLHHQIDALKESAEQLAQTRLALSRTEADLDACRSQLELAVQEKTCFSDQLIGCQKQVQDSDQMAEELLSNIQDFTTTVERLQVEKTALAEHLEAESGRVRDLQLRLQSLESAAAQEKDGAAVAAEFEPRISRMEAELEQTRQQAQAYWEKMGELECAKMELEDRCVQQAEEHNELLERTVVGLRRDLEAADGERREAVERHQQLEKTMDGLRRDLEEANGERQEAEERNDQLENKLDGLREQLSALHDAFNANFHETTALQNQLTDMQRSKQELEERNQHLQAGLDRMKDKLGTANLQVDDRLDEMAPLLEQFSQLGREKEELAKAKEQLTKRNSDLETELLSLQQSMSGASDGLSLMKDQLHQLTADQEESTRERDQAKAWIAALEQQYADLSASHNVTVEEASALSRQVNDLQDHVQRAQSLLSEREGQATRVSELEANLDAVQRQLDQIMWERDCLNQQVEALHRSLQQVSDQRDQLVAQLGQQMEQQQQLQQGHTEALQAAMARLEEDKKLLESQLNQLRTEAEDAQRQLGEALALAPLLDEARASNEFLLTEQARFQTDIQDAQRKFDEEKQQLETQLTSLQLVSDQLATQLGQQLEQQQQGQAEVLQVAMAQLEEDKKLLESQLLQLRTEAEDAQRQLGEALALAPLLDEARARNEILVAEQSRFQTDVQEIGLLRVRLAELESELDDLKYQTEDYQVQVTDMESKLAEDGEVRQVLEATVSSLGVKVNELQSDLVTLQSQKDESDSQLLALTAEKDELLKQLAETQERASQLDNLRTELSEAQVSAQASQASQNELLERLAVLTEQVNQLDEMRSRLAEAEGSVQASEASQKELQQQMAAASDRVGQLQVMLQDEKEKSGTLQADAERMVTRVELLESQLAQVADERAELTQRAHDQETTLRNQLDEANTLCQRYKEEREGQIEELSLLRVNLFETMTERDELQSTVDVQEEELETIKSDLSQARARCFELEASQVQSRSELDSATSSLKQELESMRRQQEEAEAFLSQQRSEFELATATLQQELESLREKKFGESEAFVAQQRTEFESKISTLTQELEESKSASSQQRTVVDALQQELDSLHRQHREAEAFLAQQRTEFELTMSNLQQELESLRQKKFGESEAFVAEQRAQFEATVAALKQELEASETSSSQQRAELDDLQRELESLRQLRGQSDEFLSQERTEFELAISTLRGELESMAKQRTQYELVISTSQQELESLRQANATLAGDSKSQEELQLRCSSLQHELEAQHSSLTQRQSQLELELAEAKSALAGHRADADVAELAALRVALLDVTGERDDLQASVDELEQVRADADEKLIELGMLGMERDELAAQLAHVTEEKSSQIDDLRTQLAELSNRLVQTEQRMSQVSMERDQLQQSVSRAESLDREKGQSETQEKSLDISSVDDQVEALQKRLAAAETELHETRIKAAKSLRQVKLLKTELTKQKAQQPQSNDDYFNSAVEEELRKQATDAEKQVAEKVKEVERLLLRIDTLEGANERFLQSKERQDHDMALLQHRNRELLAQISSLEWDNADKEKAPPAVVEEAAVADAAPVANAAPHEQVAELEARISQLTDDNEQYQDLLEELKGEYQAAEAQLNAEINRLKAQLQQQEEGVTGADNRDGGVSEAYDTINALRTELAAATAAAEELRKENENLVDMIRQLSTTGTLDAATVRRLREEIQDQPLEGDSVASDVAGGDADTSTEDMIDWRGSFNELQIEVEYLRSQNTLLRSQLEEAGLPGWSDGVDASETGSEAPADGVDHHQMRLELDTAVRSLHERDMRCQELTWEITKLLEERDTLQLRLSNAMRHNHEIHLQLKDSTDGEDTTITTPPGDLTVKLQELKQINYSLDVQLKREQEERQKIERQLMALYGSRGQYTPPPGPAAASAASGAASANHSPGRLVRLNTADDFYHHETSDLSNSRESLGSGQVLSEWLKGRSVTDVQHV